MFNCLLLPPSICISESEVFVLIELASILVHKTFTSLLVAVTCQCEGGLVSAVPRRRFWKYMIYTGHQISDLTVST